MSLFGGQQPASQPAPSLFGASSQSTSLFGAPTQTAASLFGAPAQSSASLFGAPAQSSASLFGPSQTSASLFGAPQQNSTSLFGAPQTTASVFGVPQSSPSLAAAPQTMFGAAPTAPSLFGGGGQQQQQQQQQQQHHHQPQLQEITGRTRISQLPQNFQTDLFAVERHLREQRTKGSKLWSKRIQFESDIGQTKSQAINITGRLVKLRANLESLKANSDGLKAAVRTERASAEPVLIALENYKTGHAGEMGFFGGRNPLSYGGLAGHGNDGPTRVPEEYFIRIVEELESRAHEYKGEIDEIAEYLRAQGIVLSRTPGTGGHRIQGSFHMSTMENVAQRHMDVGMGGSEEAVLSRGKTIEEVIRLQYEYFMVVASHIASVHENLRSVREQFLQLLRARDPDVLDPFHQADLREKAERDRDRVIAEKRASEDMMGFVTNTGASSAQGSLFRSQSSGLGMGSSAFGSTSLGLSGQNNGFGGGGSSGFGLLSDGVHGISQGRRTSTGRRRRS